MSETHFIGRHSDLEAIQQQLYHCLSGQPRIVLLQGLAGAGKTRLLQKVQTIAATQGMEITIGSSDEMMAEPCGSFVGLLPRLEAGQVLKTQEVTRLHRLFGVSTPTASTLTLDVDAQDHAHTLLSVSGGLLRLAEEQPHLIVVENLHAMDQASLDVFTHLAFTLIEQKTAPVLIVGSYRPVAPETAIGRLLSRLWGKSIVHTLELSGFDESETRELLQDLGVTRPTQQLVQTIHQATHGFPLFIQEAVHHAERCGALYLQGEYLAVHPQAVATLELPQNISAAITARLEALPPDCIAILALAALLGDGFSYDRLIMVG